MATNRVREGSLDWSGARYQANLGGTACVVPFNAYRRAAKVKEEHRIARLQSDVRRQCQHAHHRPGQTAPTQRRRSAGADDARPRACLTPT